MSSTNSLPAAPRNKDQSIGIWLNESIVTQPEKLDAMTADIARSGYGFVRAMLRNTNFSHTPSLPDAGPRSDRFRCGGGESKFLAEMEGINICKYQV